jgi:hypothetical protein
MFPSVRLTFLIVAGAGIEDAERTDVVAVGFQVSIEEGRSADFSVQCH